jgi:hypothetical protein
VVPPPSRAAPPPPRLELAPPSARVDVVPPPRVDSAPSRREDVASPTQSMDVALSKVPAHERLYLEAAYDAFFVGMTKAPTQDKIWRSRAPYGCKFFAWLVSRNRCWTADRLQCQGLQHPPACPLCDQDPQTLRHLLLGCVVAR